jgi:hypothetical protein
MPGCMYTDIDAERAGQPQSHAFQACAIDHWAIQLVLQLSNR